jgi:hypothetical protein
MAEDPVRPQAPSVDANDLGTKDCSSGKKKPLEPKHVWSIRVRMAAPLKSNQNITAVPIVEPKITRTICLLQRRGATYPRPRGFFATD